MVEFFNFFFGIVYSIVVFGVIILALLTIYTAVTKG